MDATIATFHAPPAGHGVAPPSITMMRVPARPGETLRTHAGRTLVRVAKEAPGFELRGTDDLRVDKRAAALFRFRFESRRGTVEQTLVVVDSEEDDEQKVTLFSTASTVDLADEAHGLLLETLRSVRFEGRAPHRAVTPSVEPAIRAAGEPFAPPLSIPMPGVRRR
jgi:hypothetical protein